MRILLPIDHSKFSQEALRTVASLVRPRRNQVRVLHVIEHTSAYFSADMIPRVVKHTAQLERDRMVEAQVLVHRAVEKLRGAGLDTKGVVERGNAKSVIMDYARNWGADLIVVGSHGLTGLRRVLMGSVSNAVFRGASCSVQVVRMRTTKNQAKRKTRSRRRS